MNSIYSRKGFTVIELLIIIVILGIVAAVAIPKFFDLSRDAQQSAVNRIAVKLAKVSSNNYAGCSAKSHVPTVGVCMTISRCSDAANLLTTPITLSTAGVAIADQYNLAVDNIVSVNGSRASCTLQIMRNGITYTSIYPVIGAGH